MVLTDLRKSSRDPPSMYSKMRRLRHYHRRIGMRSQGTDIVKTGLFSALVQLTCESLHQRLVE